MAEVRCHEKKFKRHACTVDIMYRRPVRLQVSVQNGAGRSLSPVLPTAYGELVCCTQVERPACPRRIILVERVYPVMNNAHTFSISWQSVEQYTVPAARRNNHGGKRPAARDSPRWSWVLHEPTPVRKSIPEEKIQIFHQSL